MGGRFEIKLTRDNQFYFVLVAPNGEIVGISEMYTTKAMCKEGIDAVKRYAPTAPMEDKSY